MKAMETAVEPRDVNPILAEALQLFKDKALEILRALTKRSANLPEGWEHIEDALVVQEGKSQTIARAFAKVFRKASPQAIWIEFGHRMVGHRPARKDTGKYVTANPFFRPAFDITRRSMLTVVRKGIAALLKRQAMAAGFTEGTGSGFSPDDTGWIG